MSASLSQNVITAALLGGIAVQPVKTNNPPQYADRQRQFFDPETRAFTKLTARYSSDFVEARVQGLKDDAKAWGTYRLRFADVVRPSAAIQRHFDDYKQYLFESPLVEYVQPGTKIETMGSTWRVVNPANISGASGSGLCRRCNAVWNYLDYYGNVVSEPIVVENERANANESDRQASMLISKGYFNVICQYNEATAQIDTNTRMILGTAAYRVTGFSDFETEFSGNYSTVRLLSFTVRYEEPNNAIDDLENHVAGGKTFSWSMGIAGPDSMAVGTTAQFSVESIRNGQTLAAEGGSWPLTYLWESDNPDVATVDENGNVTTIAEGEAVIKATLAQNDTYSASATVLATEREHGVYFTSAVPHELSPYTSVKLTAAFFEAGTETADSVDFAFFNADTSAYTAEYDGEKGVTVTCYGFSPEPLRIVASCGGYSAQTDIWLEGI